MEIDPQVMKLDQEVRHALKKDRKQLELNRNRAFLRKRRTLNSVKKSAKRRRC